MKCGRRWPPGWKPDLNEAISTAGVLDPTSRVLVVTYAYGITVANGALVPEAFRLLVS